MKTIITKMSIIGLIVLMMASCRKDPEMPSGELVNIKTNEITEITGYSAVVSAYVGADCDERGVCWSESDNPTVAGSHTTEGGGIGTFTSELTGLAENTTYYVRAYATNSCGTSYGGQKSFTTDSYNGHLYVDLGLPSGLLWATCNIGADKPDDYGWYFMCGSTTNGGDPNCSWANCPGNGGSSSSNSSANSAWNATHLTNGVLNLDVDAANANWGGDWRMPTRAEFKELYDNTTCTWTTENGVYGRKFVSKADSSKSIFLPAAGYRYGTDLDDVGSRGRYWSSSVRTGTLREAYFMDYAFGYVEPQHSCDRCYGFSVRPVHAAR